MPEKKTVEQIAEENDRTNEVGLFNFADAYFLCAKQLVDCPPRHLRFEDPICFLMFHAAELYLKSYLRQKGEDLDAIKKLGRSHTRMVKKAAALGLNLPPKICEIFELLDRNNALIKSRYIVTGFTKRIETRKLCAVVEELRTRVKVSHEEAKVKLGAIRLP